MPWNIEEKQLSIQKVNREGEKTNMTPKDDSAQLRTTAFRINADGLAEIQIKSHSF